jgi:hypothetical protein
MVSAKEKSTADICIIKRCIEKYLSKRGRLHWRGYDAINIKSLLFIMRIIVLSENMITCININL